MQLLKWVTKIQAMAQNGLAYCRDDFDRERYLQLMQIASEMAAAYSSNVDESDIYKTFSMEAGYATPKIDVRALILENDKLLLVKERSDNLWTLPGGWADVNESATEATVKEVKEETGYDVSIVRFLAFWDKLKHDHPPQWPHAYKCFFQCKIEGGSPQENMEISDIAFFTFDNLPELSTNRVTKNQIMRLKEIITRQSPTAFD